MPRRLLGVLWIGRLRMFTRFQSGSQLAKLEVLLTFDNPTRLRLPQRSRLIEDRRWKQNIRSIGYREESGIYYS